jgi:hypothetical protein
LLLLFALRWDAMNKTPKASFDDKSNDTSFLFSSLFAPRWKSAIAVCLFVCNENAVVTDDEPGAASVGK